MNRKINFWNQTEIEKAIKNFINTDVDANLKFPSAKLLRSKKRADLENAINRSGGFIYWRKKMGYDEQNISSVIGWGGEEIVKQILTSMGYKVEKQTSTSFYDFVVNDCVRIECKFSNVYRGKTGEYFSFNLERKEKDCDIFIIVCKYKNTSLKILVIPHIKVFNQKQISVGLENSKWDCYENKFDYIDKYEKFYKGL